MNNQDPRDVPPLRQAPGFSQGGRPTGGPSPGARLILEEETLRVFLSPGRTMALCGIRRESLLAILLHAVLICSAQVRDAASPPAPGDQRRPGPPAVPEVAPPEDPIVPECEAVGNRSMYPPAAVFSSGSRF